MVDIADLVIWGGDTNMIVILREPFRSFRISNIRGKLIRFFVSLCRFQYLIRCNIVQMEPVVCRVFPSSWLLKIALPDVPIVEIDFWSINYTYHILHIFCRWSCFLRNSKNKTQELLDTISSLQWKKAKKKNEHMEKSWHLWHIIDPSNVRQEPWVPSSPLWMPCWAFATPRPIFERFMGGEKKKMQQPMVPFSSDSISIFKRIKWRWLGTKNLIITLPHYLEVVLTMGPWRLANCFLNEIENFQ